MEWWENFSYFSSTAENLKDITSRRPANHQPADVMDGLFAAYVIIMVVSLVGNSSIIRVVFSRPRNSRTSTCYHLANMACADLFITVVAMPLWAYFICVRLEWLGGVAGDVTCKIATAASIMSVLASTLTLVVMATDRFLAVFFPLRRITMHRNTRKLALAVWVIAVVFGAPSLYMYTVRHEGNSLQCLNNLDRVNLTLRHAYYLLIFGLMFALPATVMSVMYSMVAYRLWFREIPGNQTDAGRRALVRSRKRTLRLLIVLMLAFKACWLPVYVEWFLEVFESKERRVELSIMLAHANSALNPCLCFLLNSRFRLQLLAMIRRCCCFGPGMRHPVLGSRMGRGLSERYSSTVVASQRRRHYQLTGEIPKEFTPVTILHMTNYAATWEPEATGHEETCDGQGCEISPESEL